ncbi:MAG: hypothetical protein DCF25_05850 [Leptolyngbya foveolarum]|uniref:TIR domain-containing protein n=1 Tax=Leptolyngbya foveolarum TaxID=47253 RepID=A0A2W4W944_9CYAN|nr:MAG: hypothetical protein DCF25_05850 [Leptolyngbya foveolarum]
MQDAPQSLIEKCEQIGQRLLSKSEHPASSRDNKELKDFFVSYNSADSEWAEWIAWTLEEIGYSVVIQAWDFRPGGNFILDMQKATTETKCTVMVLSDNYTKALYTQPEWAAAFVQDPTGSSRKLLPIKVSPCILEGMLSTLIYIDLVDKPQAEARNLLTSALQERAKPKFRPGFLVSNSSIPPVSDFPGDSSSTTGEKTVLNNDNQRSAAQRRFSSRERLAILQKLNSLPLSQFEEVVFALDPPSGVISSYSLPQEGRTKALLVWLESPEGLGLEELDDLLEVILSKRPNAEEMNKEQNTGVELIQELIQALSLNQGSSYDFRGAQFSGGFAETVHGNQAGHISNKEEKTTLTNLISPEESSINFRIGNGYGFDECFIKTNVIVFNASSQNIFIKDIEIRITKNTKNWLILENREKINKKEGGILGASFKVDPKENMMIVITYKGKGKVKEPTQLAGFFAQNRKLPAILECKAVVDGRIDTYTKEFEIDVSPLIEHYKYQWNTCCFPKATGIQKALSILD